MENESRFTPDVKQVVGLVYNAKSYQIIEKAHNQSIFIRPFPDIVHLYYSYITDKI